MILDYRTIEALALEFMRRRGDNFITGRILPGDADSDLGSLTHKFNALYVETLHADNVVSGGSSSDMVDGFHASATPQPNTLLALNASGVFPTSVYASALLRTGGTMTGNINMAAGALVDGVDVNLFKAAYDLHLQTDHNTPPVHTHADAAQGGVLVRYASAEGYGSQAAFRANRLNRSVLAGNGLTGGGLLDQNIRLDVSVGPGLRLDSLNRVAMDTPGALSATSTNAATSAHTHAVTSSSDPTGASLLRTTDQAGLRVQRLALGSAAIPSLAGNLAASGDVQGNRIIADQNAFVGNDLSVGTSVLNTVRARGAVYINRDEPNPTLQGALTLRPVSATQRGLVIQGRAGQATNAPLLTIADGDGVDALLVQADGTLESGGPAFVSGLRGWRITREGDAEFRNITARGELHTSVFVANEIHAAGGTLAVMPTGVVDSPIIAADNVIDTTFNLVVAGNPNIPGACDFTLNDVLRIKLMVGLEEN